MTASSMLPSNLSLEGLHVLVSGAGGGIERQAVREFLDQGCKVTTLNINPLGFSSIRRDGESLYTLESYISDEQSVTSSFAQAVNHHGPINILVVYAGVTYERSADCPIWDLPLDTWEDTHRVNSRRVFLAVKHFLRSVRTAQQTLGKELENLAIVVVGSGTELGMVRSVKNEIVRLNGKARINAVESGVPFKKSANPEDVARTIAFLASHRAAGHISGQCISVDGDVDCQLIQKETNATRAEDKSTQPQSSVAIIPSIPQSITKPKTNKIRITISIDLDAVSGWLGTGQHPDNVLADYSSGFFAARVGVPRLLKMLKKLNLADRCTWFIPGHSAESFPEEVKQVVDSGCEIGLHGYAHEGAYQLTAEQERDVLVRCIEIATKLTGKKPAGYRAPLYQVRESTLDLLEEFGFEYDASLTDHDSQPFFAPSRPPLTAPNFTLPASTWMHPIPGNPDKRKDRRPLVCVPCNYYMEDMTPLQFLPHVPNSHGYTDVRVIENLWKDRFLWLRENEQEDCVFPLVMHPDTSGMAHVIGMVERFLTWCKGWGDGKVEFCQTGEVARWWREREEEKENEKER